MATISYRRKTFYLSDEDVAAIREIKEFSGASTDSSALRQTVRKEAERIRKERQKKRA